MSATSDITIKTQQGYVEVKLTGEYSLEREKEFATQIANYCRQEHISKVLVDMAGQREIVPIVDRMELGDFFSEIWPSHTRLALLVSREQILPDNLHFQAAASKRGVQVKVCLSIDEAKSFLEV